MKKYIFKKRSKKNLLFVGILTLLLVGSCQDDLISPTAVCTFDNSVVVNANHPKAAVIQAKLDEYVAKGLPGATVLISDSNGIWVGSAGYADLENGVLMQPCHLNKLGSVTKMMVGALVWQLIQEGKLSLDAPISTYIPEVASRLTNGEAIKLSMLLNHTSGVYDIARDLGFNLAVINDFSKSWTAEEILKFIENKPATNLPGEKASYSNSNTLLEGMIIEAVTGQPHGDLLKTRIFEPLGMTNTVYYDYSTAFPYDRLAQGYLDFNNNGKGIQNISQLNPGSGNGYTGVYSTVTDLYHFMNALLREKTLTSPFNLDLILANMTTTESGTWESSFGGIHNEWRDVLPNGINAYGHAGGDIGYSANLNFFPHNNTIFAATYNYGTNLSSELGDQLHQLRIDLALIMAE